jgi:hypothetical protein
MHSLIQPETACSTCWRAWLNSRPRKSLGYCWHGKVAWRVRPSGEFITAADVDRAKHLGMVRALQKRETSRNQPAVATMNAASGFISSLVSVRESVIVASSVGRRYAGRWAGLIT